MSAIIIAGAAALILNAKKKAAAPGPVLEGLDAQILEWTKVYSVQYSIDWRVARTVSWIESKHGKDPRVALGIKTPTDTYNSRSYDNNSWGVFQEYVSTTRDMLRVNKNPAWQTLGKSGTDEQIKVFLNNPENSIHIGCQYLAWCRTWLLKNTKITAADPRFIEFWIKSYNQGIGKTRDVINGKGTDNADAKKYWTNFVPYFNNVA